MFVYVLLFVSFYFSLFGWVDWLKGRRECFFDLTEMLINYFVMEYWLIYHALCQVPILSVHRAIKSWPFLLGCSTSKLKLMVEEFGELGIQNKKLGQVIAKSPQLLLRKPQELLQVGVTGFIQISGTYIF